MNGYKILNPPSYIYISYILVFDLSDNGSIPTITYIAISIPKTSNTGPYAYHY